MKTTRTLTRALPLALALALPNAAPAAITDRPPPAIPGAFRIVTANLRGHDGGETEPSKTQDKWHWDAINDDYHANPAKQTQYPRRKILRDTIIAQHAAIYCFQECSWRQIRDLLDAMPGYAAFKYSRTVADQTSWSDSGEAILYSTTHFTLLDQDHFWLTPDPRNQRIHPAINSNRDANWARLKDNHTGREFVIWFTHLQHNDAAYEATGGNRQARRFEITMLLNTAALNPPGTPQLLLADMNVGYTDEVLRATLADGWRDTYTETYGNPNPGRTHHGFAPAAGGTKIDFILARGPIQTLGAEIIKDHATLAGTPRYPSDHYFVSAIIKLDTTTPAPAPAGTLAPIDTLPYATPAGIALDTTGALYIADETLNTLYKNTAPLAGPGPAGTPGCTDAAGPAARFTAPRALAHQDGYLYIADSDNRAIRLLDTTDPAAPVTLYSGNPSAPPAATDGPPATATYARAASLALAPDGTAYIADSDAHAIRKIAPDGHVTTLAGTPGQPGHADGPAPAATFREPLGLALSPDTRTLYIADTGNHTLRALDLATGQVTTPAGHPAHPGWADGHAAAARFNSPAALAAATGTLYIADTGNHALRALDLATGAVTRLAGATTSPPLPAAVPALYLIDGGPAEARFNHPTGLALDAAAQTLYIADTGNGALRKIDLATRQTTTLFTPARIGADLALTATAAPAAPSPPVPPGTTTTTTIKGGAATGDTGGGAPPLPTLALLALLPLARRYTAAQKA
jgi:sugar lactone lactonase YvrE